MSRRNMLKGIGIAGAAIAVSPAVLAACGDDSGSSAATTAGGGGAATTAAGGAATTGGAASGDVGATLAKLLEIDAATSGAGMEFKMGNVLALTGHRVVLRQDHDPRPRPGRQAHRGGRRPDDQRHIPRPQVGRRRGRQAGDHRARRKKHPGQVRVLRRRPRRDARRHGAVQDVHARRRRRHQHLRPGPAVLLGHPGDHAQRPDAGPVQVDEGDLPRRQDHRARSAGTSASRTTATSRPTS